MVKLGPLDISVRKQAQEVQGALEKAGYQFHKIDRAGSRIDRWGGSEEEFEEQLQAITDKKQFGNAWSPSKKVIYKRFLRLRREVNWTGVPEGAAPENSRFGRAYTLGWNKLAQAYWDLCDSDCEDAVAENICASLDIQADNIIGGSWHSKDALGTTIIGLQSNSMGGFGGNPSNIMDEDLAAALIAAKGGEAPSRKK